MATKYKYHNWISPEGLVLIEGWARDGLVDDQIARKMGISRKTLNEWKTKHPAIGDALKNGKEYADYLVENALFKSALGYYVEEQEEKLTLDGSVVNTKRQKYIAPDKTAQIFWLKNRRPDKWRDKPDSVKKMIAEIKHLEADTKRIEASMQKADSEDRVFVVNDLPEESAADE